jgi:thiol-disulfide isomerase/thioredoxin
MTYTPQQEISAKKPAIVFLLTIGLFAVAFLASQYVYSVRTQTVNDIEANINRQILESEIQFQLLSDAACDDPDSPNIMLNEINSLAKKLENLESQRGDKDPEVVSLKKNYTLLLVKNYLLLRDRSTRCDEQYATIIYFYSTKDACPDCEKAGIVLSDLRKQYDRVHVYAIDYDLGLPAIETLKSIYRLNGSKLPALVIDRKPYYGFKSKEDIVKLFPEGTVLSTPKATTTASTTSSTSTKK